MTQLLSLTGWRAGVLLALLGVATAYAPAGLATDAYSEEAVKAVFLSRFAGYVEWPPAAAADAPFTIAVLGADGVAAELQRLLPNYPIHQRPAQVRRLRRVSELGDAQILYIGPGRGGDIKTAVAALTSRPVLVVTDDEHGLDEGGAVNFLRVDQRVRFEVSVLAAERAGLRIGAEILAAAARVQGGRRRSDAGCGASGSPVDRSGDCVQRVSSEAPDDRSRGNTVSNPSPRP